MSEEELNKKWLKEELKGFSYSNELFDKILDLLSKQYINGLEQSRFEKNVLEQENQELKKRLSNSHQMKNQQKKFLQWLENKMKETHYTIFEFQAYSLAFEKYKEIISDSPATDLLDILEEVE